MSQQKITIALIGHGYWGPNLLRNFQNVEGVFVKYVCDQDPAKLKKLQAMSYGTQATTEMASILNDEHVDAIILATPAATHYQLAKQVLERKKHVFVEKPLATKSSECIDLIKTAEQNQRLIMVGHVFEFNPAVEKLREIINNPASGKVLYLYSTRVNLGQVREDINAMWNLAPHDISILLYLMQNEPVAVTAHGTCFIRPGIEDVVFIYLEFANNTIAHIHVSWLDPSKIRRLTLVMDKLMVIYDDIDNEAKVKIYDKAVEKPFFTGDSPLEYQIKLRAGDILIPRLSTKEPLAVECQHFIECIRQGKTPKTDGYNGLRVVKVLEAAQESIKNQGKRVLIA